METQQLCVLDFYKKSSILPKTAMEPRVDDSASINDKIAPTAGSRRLLNVYVEMY